MNLAFVTRLLLRVISSSQTGIIPGTEKGIAFVHEKYP